jgi:hypothetical protein
VYWRATIGSVLPPDEVLARIGALIVPRATKLSQFKGEVRGDAFAITRTAGYRKSLRPVLRGRVEMGPNGGSLVRVQAYFRYLLVVLISLCLAAYYASGGGTMRFDIILAALAILLVTFAAEVFIGLRMLRRAIDA